VTATSVLPGFQPVSAETGKEMNLAMQRLWLVGRILPVGARLLVRHTFRSSEKKPIEVIYAFGLPRDAALRRFRVSGEGFSVRSALKLVEEATKAYEAGIEAGRLSTLVKQYGDGLVNLTLGNIRPEEEVTVSLEVLAGVEAHDDGIRFRFPFTLAPGYHSKARVAEVKPGVGEIELPEDEFGDLILPQFAADPSALHQVGFDLSVWMAQKTAEIGSPSHALRVLQEDGLPSRVFLATEREAPSRDLVLDVRTEGKLPTLVSGLDNTGKGRFAAIVPSTSFGERSGGPRQVVFVLDRSGSMGGAPIQQARKAVEACLGALAKDDRFGLVAFDDRVETFRGKLAEGTLESREQARQFLQRVDARGGTELAAGVREAARLLGGEGGDLMVLTDGQVFGTEAILEQARATGIRIHCLGIGSASQDRFLSLLARETGGVSRFLTPRERVDLPAVDLFASIGRPVASGLAVTAEGVPGASLAPEPPRTVFAGTPLVVFGECDGAADGRLELAFEQDHQRRNLEVPLVVRDSKAGETLRLLQGARLITDLESRFTGAEEHGAAGKREEQRVAKRLEALSLAYGLASRRMALVAVVERAGDRPGELPQTRIVPVGMAQDTAFSAYFAPPSAACYAAAPLSTPGFLRSIVRGATSAMAGRAKRPQQPPIRMARYAARGPEDLLQDLAADLSRAAPDVEAEMTAFEVPRPSEYAAADVLLDLASRIEPDGGMPGNTDEERALATILALLCFLAEGHTVRSGAFRSHVERLVTFLESATCRREVVEQILALARQGKVLPGDWGNRKPTPDLWRELENALQLTS